MHPSATRKSQLLKIFPLAHIRQVHFRSVQSSPRLIVEVFFLTDHDTGSMGGEAITRNSAN